MNEEYKILISVMTTINKCLMQYLLTVYTGSMKLEE